MIVLPMWPSVSPTGHHQIVHVLGENGADSVNRVVSIEPFALGSFASASNARRQFRLGLWPKDKAWRHAPPASLRRTFSQGMAESGFAMCSASRRSSSASCSGVQRELGLALGVGEAVPQRHGDLDPLTRGELEQLSE